MFAGGAFRSYVDAPGLPSHGTRDTPLGDGAQLAHVIEPAHGKAYWNVPEAVATRFFHGIPATWVGCFHSCCSYRFACCSAVMLLSPHPNCSRVNTGPSERTFNRPSGGVDGAQHACAISAANALFQSSAVPRCRVSPPMRRRPFIIGNGPHERMTGFSSPFTGSFFNTVKGVTTLLQFVDAVCLVRVPADVSVSERTFAVSEHRGARRPLRFGDGLRGAHQRRHAETAGHQHVVRVLLGVEELPRGPITRMVSPAFNSGNSAVPLPTTANDKAHHRRWFPTPNGRGISLLGLLEYTSTNCAGSMSRDEFVAECQSVHAIGQLRLSTISTVCLLGEESRRSRFANGRHERCAAVMNSLSVQCFVRCFW